MPDPKRPRAQPDPAAPYLAAVERLADALRERGAVLWVETERERGKLIVTWEFYLEREGK
jgi:hypothetical protein